MDSLKPRDAGKVSGLTKLTMPAQDLDRLHFDDSVPQAGSDNTTTIIRLVGLTGVLLLLGFFAWSMYGVLAPQGISTLEAVMLVFFLLGTVGLSIGAVTALMGVYALVCNKSGLKTSGAMTSLDIALLLPIYEEEPEQVFANAVAMLNAVSAAPGGHRYSLYVLSDTRTPLMKAREQKTFAKALTRTSAAGAFYYRNRAENTDRKAGNIQDWVINHGENHDAMLVLDADSLMSRDAILELSNALAGDPAAGLVQTVPRLIKSTTLFARVQQFSNALYGPLLARGFHLWAGGEGNYWGHNAIMRTKAFAATAGLPRLNGKAPFGGSIMSHDFVEAALLRRAGWQVRLLPSELHSFEETPPTLVDHVLRDRRWCQGNLQHLAVIMTRGLHIVSRFHLLHGAMAYLSSCLWLGFLMTGAFVAFYAGGAPVNYFPEPYAFIPRWPVMDSEKALHLMLMTIALLLMPKILGLITTIAADPLLKRWGGWGKFMFSVPGEIILSAILAPGLMVQHVGLVCRIFMGRDAGWTPQRRDGVSLTIWTLMKFHSAELGLAVILSIGIWFGWLTPQIWPVLLGLWLAFPLSWMMQYSARRPKIFATPEIVDPPSIIMDATLLAIDFQAERAVSAA